VLVADVPDAVVAVRQVVDSYLDGTRAPAARSHIDAYCRVRGNSGTRSDSVPGRREIACASIHLDDLEWEPLRAHRARALHKTRRSVEREVRRVVDRLEHGALLAEIDGGGLTHPSDWSGVLREVTAGEQPTCQARDATAARAKPHSHLVLVSRAPTAPASCRDEHLLGAAAFPPSRGFRGRRGTGASRDVPADR
jgi:hypothetical protein